MMKEKQHNVKMIAILGVIASFAAILSYIEAIISFDIWVPGVKLGLANLAIVLVLYWYGSKEAILVNIVRILIVGLLFGNTFSILFSLAGAFISLIAMSITKKINLFTVLGVSVSGGVFHNIGQMFVATFVVKSYSIVYYIPVLIIAGVITGTIIGIVAGKLLERFKEI